VARHQDISSATKTHFFTGGSSGGLKAGTRPGWRIIGKRFEYRTKDDIGAIRRQAV